jgi:crotonobetaine/carnitine-CoA ligase
VISLPSAHGDDEVLVAVVPRPGATGDPEQLVRHLIPRMPHFMVPRYVRILATLPRTPTQKVQKHVLRTEGVTADTWDRDQAGLRIRRTELS